MFEQLKGITTLLVHQRHEAGEFFGFETRNKYDIMDEGKTPIGFAGEQQKGFFGFILRQFFGHWRTFDIIFFDANRQPVMVAHHPFRFLFQRLEISDMNSRILGAIQQRFALFSKRFDVEDANGLVLFRMSSPIWKIWTFPLYHQDRQVGVILKKWSGILSEGFTDKDNFIVKFEEPSLSLQERTLMMAASLFVDLQYFERKAGR